MNRQSRALLTILIVAAVMVPYWLLRDGGPLAPSGDDQSISRTYKPGANDPGANEVPQRGGAIVTSNRTDPRSFNRLIAAQFATELFAQFTQSRLVRINRATQALEPLLAESWTASPDARGYTLKLRQGVTWSDGTPFSSADVLFTFEALYATSGPVVSAVRVDGKPLKVSAPDAHTVVLEFPAVFAPGMRLLDTVWLMPKHKLEAAHKAGQFPSAWGAGTPPAELVGLGPFVLVQYQPGQRLVYERNPRYWRRDERGVQLPYLDRVTLEIVSDQDAEFVRLQSGQLDFTQQGLRAPDVAALKTAAGEGRVRIVELGVLPDADMFAFNLWPERWQKDPRGPWFTRKEFRQALSHAVDRESFARTVYLGTAVPIHGPITPGNKEWFTPNLPRYGFDRARSRALLEGIGLRNRDSDEWLEDDRGNDARFSLLVYSTNALMVRSAEVLRDEFRQVGIAMDVVPMEPNEIGARVTASRDFDAAFIQFTATDLDPAVNKDLWMSAGGSHFWNVLQKTPATDWERQIDELMLKQASTLDQEERKRLFAEVQRLVAENLPVLNFAAPRVFIGVSNRMINLQPALTRPNLLWSPDSLAVRGGAQSTAPGGASPQ